MPNKVALAAALSVLAPAIGVTASDLPVAAAGASATHTVAADGPADFASVQAAVDAAVSGDTVVVKPGTYSGPIEIDTDLRLVGAGPRETVVITASAEAPLGRRFALLLTGGSVTVADLTVATPDDTIGVTATAGAPLIERVKFTGPEESIDRSSARVHRPFVSMRFAGDTRPTVRDSAWDGYDAVRDGASAVFAGNTVVGDTISIDGPGESSVRDSVFLRGSISVSWNAIGLIEGNVFNGDLGQVGVDSGSIGEVRGNTFTGSADDAAIWIADRATSAVVTGNTVTDSRIAVRISGAGSATVEANTLEASEIGIAIMDTDAHIEGNTIESHGAGIAVAFGADPTITANTVKADGHAITVTRDSGAVIIGNDICGGETGIQADASAGLHVADNEICEDTTAG
jgi:hypothetical protein